MRPDCRIRAANEYSIDQNTGLMIPKDMGKNRKKIRKMYQMKEILEETSPPPREEEVISKFQRPEETWYTGPNYGNTNAYSFPDAWY